MHRGRHCGHGGRSRLQFCQTQRLWLDARNAHHVRIGAADALARPRSHGQKERRVVGQIGQAQDDMVGIGAVRLGQPTTIGVDLTRKIFLDKKCKKLF